MANASGYPATRSGSPLIPGGRPSDFRGGQPGTPPSWVPSEFSELFSRPFEPSLRTPYMHGVPLEPWIVDLMRQRFSPSDLVRASARLALRRFAPFAAFELARLAFGNRGFPFRERDIDVGVPDGWHRVFGPCIEGADHYEDATNGECAGPQMAHFLSSPEYWPGKELGFAEGETIPAGQLPANYGVARWRLRPELVSLLNPDLVVHEQFDLIRGPVSDPQDVTFPTPARRILPQENLPRESERGDDEPNTKRVLVSGVEVVLDTQTVTIGEPPDKPRGRRYGRRDIKARINIAGLVHVRRVISKVTEAMDFATCMYDALPPAWRRRAPKTMQGRSARVLDYLGRLAAARDRRVPGADAALADYLKRAFKCVVENQLEDLFFGFVGRKSAEASMRLLPFRPVGVQTGQWAWRDLQQWSPPSWFS